MRASTRAARVWLELVSNFNYDFVTNGELNLLNRLAESQPAIIFDVGANVGDWTAAALTTGAKVYAFELIPSTAARLREKLGALATVEPFGLYSESRFLKVKYYPGFSPASSIMDFPHALHHEWVDAEVRRGDDYCRIAGLDRIDFLKIDTEGVDHQVIRGFDSMLEAGLISIVQFEYGRANIESGVLLKNLYEMFDDWGMSVGKIYPDGVEFADYNMFRDEDFLGPNYLAVKRDRRDLISLLGSSEKWRDRR